MATATTKTKIKSASPRKKVEKTETVRLRIKVRGYDHTLVDQSVKQIIDTALRLEASVVGPIPLPTDTKKFTVNRAAFIDKDSREQFEMRTHKRILDIMNPTGKVVDALTNLSLPSGVSVDVKTMT